MPDAFIFMQEKFNQDVVEVLYLLSKESNRRSLRSDELQLQGILRVMLSLSNPL